MERVKFDEVFENCKRMIIDGSMGTALEHYGYNLNTNIWTAKALDDAPELVKKVHLGYFEAGADCGITCSYQATIPGLMEYGFTEEKAKELIARSVTLFLEAREKWWNQEGKDSGRIYPLCLGAVGPYGAYLADGSEYRGNYDIYQEELKKFHTERMEILWKAGADLLLMETIPSLQEALIVADLAETMEADYWISFSCKDGKHTNEGDLISDCAKALSKNYPHLKMMGVNCTKPEYICDLIDEMKRETTLPIVVYPNSGEEYDPLTKTWHGKGHTMNFEEYALEYYRHGAYAVGGCCTTFSNHIEQVVKAKQKYLEETGK